ncbi:MAG: hypothetical protein LH467_12245 [Gemmatimonadaceae bacterium]|nr:hypothetical protein [Gemmatimonadaceae bacterium]
MRHLVLTCTIGLSLACALPGDASDPSTTTPGTVAPARTIIDSILPPAEEMRRFRANGGPVRTMLTGGAVSRDALARAFVQALATRDTAMIRSLVVHHVEFADLYYPASRYARPPFRTPVGLIWTQIQLNSEKGITRAMDRLGGQPVRFLGLTCASRPDSVGAARIDSRCSTRYVEPGGDTVSRRLFGAIVQLHGQAKFLSYSNDM